MTIEKRYKVVGESAVPVDVSIVRGEDLVKLYKISIPQISPATMAILNSIKEDLLRDLKIGMQEMLEPANIEKLKVDFSSKAGELLEQNLPHITLQIKEMLISYLISEMLGLGPLENLISDPDLEEIVINTSKEPVWVYHKQYGWLKTNVMIENEREIENYAGIIARRVGRQITTLEPLLDAYLITGDRANATLFPISTKGNTLTIRKFARKPWTIVDFIQNKTLNIEVAAFLWLTMQYELNMIVGGGTSSGKTSLLNSLMPFIQPNHRIVSIEDTRELQLPNFLHWVPMTTRLPNPEGKGEVSMLDLMINSLRMRPDRIVVGEIRRADQAEVLFEAMHTGHSVYSTLHADTAEQVIKRMTNPPINIPDIMMEALHLIVIQYRDRRRGIRRTYQVAEVLPSEMEEERKTRVNVLYRLKPDGTIVPHNPCVRIFDLLKMHTGMAEKEFQQDMAEKMDVLREMVKRNITDTNTIGKVIADYYSKK